MKNILLSAFVLSIVINVHVQAQSNNSMYIRDGGTVYVSPNTLLYSKGGLKATANGKLTSQGNVKLDDALENAGDGSNILFNYNTGGENTAYGQLQLSNNTTATGKITMMTQSLKLNAANGIAFPFVESTNLVEVLESSSISGLKGKIEAKNKGDVYSVDQYKDYRYNNYAWYFENDGNKKINAQQSLLHPYLLYTLNLYKDKDGKPFENINQEDFTISGIPFSKDISVELKPSLVGKNVKINDAVYYIVTPYASLAHHYNKRISDFVDSDSQNSWGHNIYGLGNPYTQNIDLFKVLDNSNLTPTMVKGISITAGIALGEEDKKGRLYKNYTLKYNTMTCSGDTFSKANCSSSSGDPFALIRPFGTFNLKLAEDFRGTTIQFSEDAKTFAYTKLGIADKGNAKGGSQPNLRQAHSKAIEELTLSLKEDNIIKEQVALAANPWATDAIDKQLDAVAGNGKINGESNDISLYLLNEKDNLRATKLSINGFNMNTYRGKSLQIALNTVPGKTYTLGGSVRIAEKKNLPHTNFFIEDKQENKIMRVGANFSYSFSASDNDSNRFVAYYARVPVDVEQKQVERVKSLIDIARNSEGDNVIVFKGQTGKAKIYVYNILGQLILSNEQVSTSVNYPLNLIPKGGVYIVKIINSEGKIITKKIIK